MTDDQLLAAFESATLTPEQFGHRQHVRLVWLHVTRLPLLEAIRVQMDGLRQLAAALGVPGKFHATITLGWLLVVHEAAHRPGAPRTWPEFERAHPELLDSKGGPLDQHYSRARLASDEARAAFVVPDLPAGPQPAALEHCCPASAHPTTEDDCRSLLPPR